MLECGHNNCGKEGGLWDAEDDCCQRRCTEDRPCEQGQVYIKKEPEKLGLIFAKLSTGLVNVSLVMMGWGFNEKDSLVLQG